MSAVAVLDASETQADTGRPCPSTEEYWATHDFGRHGRPRPGTRLIITAGPQCGHNGAKTGTVTRYDGRWHDSSFPVDLHNGLTLNFGTRPARNQAGIDVPKVYELVGAELEFGLDLHGVQGDGERVTLRAKIKYPRKVS